MSKPARIEPPWLPKVQACSVCNGFRVVNTSTYRTVPCPNCGCSCTPEQRKAGDRCENDEKFARLSIDAINANFKPPEITEADLTTEEKDLVAEWRFRWPNARMKLFLSWIEGKRYTPEVAAQDKDFQKALFIAGLGRFDD